MKDHGHKIGILTRKTSQHISPFSYFGETIPTFNYLANYLILIVIMEYLKIMMELIFCSCADSNLKIAKSAIMSTKWHPYSDSIQTKEKVTKSPQAQTRQFRNPVSNKKVDLIPHSGMHWFGIFPRKQDLIINSISRSHHEQLMAKIARSEIRERQEHGRGPRL